MRWILGSVGKSLKLRLKTEAEAVGLKGRSPNGLDF